MAQKIIQAALKAAPEFLRLRSPHVWFDYDAEADVLYVSFERPQRADDSELKPNDMIVRRCRGRIVGLTILRASRLIR